MFIKNISRPRFYFNWLLVASDCIKVGPVDVFVFLQLKRLINVPHLRSEFGYHFPQSSQVERGGMVRNTSHSLGLQSNVVWQHLILSCSSCGSLWRSTLLLSWIFWPTPWHLQRWMLDNWQAVCMACGALRMQIPMFFVWSMHWPRSLANSQTSISQLKRWVICSMAFKGSAVTLQKSVVCCLPWPHCWLVSVVWENPVRFFQLRVWVMPCMVFKV